MRVAALAAALQLVAKSVVVSSSAHAQQVLAVAACGTIHNHTDSAESAYSQTVADSVAACCHKCAAAAPKCAFATFGRGTACWLHSGSTMTPRSSSGITLIELRLLPPAPPGPPPHRHPPLPAPPATTTAIVNFSSHGVAQPHFWKASVGSGHAKLGLRADWQAQLAAVHRDIGIAGVRFHGLFDDDMHVMTATQNGTMFSYNWSAIDALWDGVMNAGVTAPIVELSYMPSAIASKPFRFTHYYKGLDVMPRDWSLWYNLVNAFGRHVVQRYGLAAVALWRFEVSDAFGVLACKHSDLRSCSCCDAPRCN